VKKGRSLQDFVESKKCFLCRIPERQEIEEAKIGGAATKHIVEWLVRERGYDEDEVQGARGMMGHHFAVHMKRPKGKNDWQATI